MTSHWGQVCLLGQGIESAQFFADVQLLGQTGHEALPGCTGQENGNQGFVIPALPKLWLQYHNKSSEMLRGNWLDLALSYLVITAQSESQARAVLCKPSE